MFDAVSDSAGALDAPHLDPGARLGPWKVLRPIGRGGSATVYEAEHAELRHRAAVKVLRPEAVLDRELRTRFLREGRALAGLRHPHLVAVYDVGSGEHGVWLVMELLSGETLSERLRRDGPLPPSDAADLALPLLAALAVVHRARVVHRDVKPSNVFVEETSAGPRVRLLDLGVSKFLGDGAAPDLTRSRALLGTPAYMSPEQALGARDVDPRSDLFSVGALLYECLTGRRPFGGDTWQQTLIAVTTARPASLRQHARALPRALDRVVLSCLARAPDDRPADAVALGDALAPFASPAARERWRALSAEFRDGRPAPKRRASRVAWAAAAVTLCLVGGSALLSRSSRSASAASGRPSPTAPLPYREREATAPATPPAPVVTPSDHSEARASTEVSPPALAAPPPGTGARRGGDGRHARRPRRAAPLARSAAVVARAPAPPPSAPDPVAAAPSRGTNGALILQH
ncbi:MAG: serine/threonine-protein kinase [Polyangiales bacterium]